jgi:predicted DsbA family dithiol-disulfide isomerase
VPTFVVNRKLAMSGANPPDQLLALLRQGWSRVPRRRSSTRARPARPTAADVRSGES